MKNSEKLLYHGNLSAETVDAMKRTRRKFVELAEHLEDIGSSRELSEAFTCLQTAMMYATAHYCYSDPNAVKECCKVVDLRSECNGDVPPIAA